MKRIYTLLAVLVLAGPLCMAQKPLKQLPKKNEVFRPEVLDASFSAEMADLLEKGHGQKVNTEGFVKVGWDVYSDRDDNPTYSTPKDKDLFSTLQFGEKVRIARFKGDFALVYIPESGEDAYYPELPKQVEWKGWVPVSHLLLWDKPLVNHVGVAQRVLLDSEVRNSTPSDNRGKLFYTPAVNAIPKSTLPGHISNSFFYILKKENGMALLSKDKTLGTEMENLYGWVSLTSLYSWDNNLALEPNWEIPVVEDFANIGFESTLCDGLNESSRIGSVSFSKGEMPYYRSDFYRKPGNVWRFLYYKDLMNRFTSAYIPANSPYLDENKSTGSAGEYAEDFNVVNVFFLMEGSRDLEDFFPAVMEHVKGIESLFPGKKVNVGSAIYHDVRDEDFAVEYCAPTNPRDRKLLDFIDMGGDYGFQENVSMPAIFPAVRKIIDDARLRPTENNVFIIVGARGDNSDIAIPDLADQLDGNNISIYGIQVQNNVSSAGHQMFSYQISGLIDAKLRSRISKTGSDTDVILRSVHTQGPVDKVHFSLNTPDNLFPEQFSAQLEGLMEVEDFNQGLEEIFASFSAQLANRQNDMAENSNASQLFRLAYPISYDNSNRPFYKYVAVYDEEEFEQMMQGFQELYELSLKTSPGTKIYNVLSKYLNVVPESNPIKTEDRGFYETFRLYEGISDLPGDYKGIPIKAIRDQKGVSAEETLKLLEYFCFKYQKLLEVKNASYPYYTQINGRKYYWIPVDYLP